MTPSVLPILLVLVGPILFILGIGWSKWFFKTNRILITPLRNGEVEFDVQAQGLYAICFIGGHVQNQRVDIRIFHADTTQVVETNVLKFTPSSYVNGKICSEYLHFTSASNSRLCLAISNSDRLRFRTSRNKLLQVFQSVAYAKDIDVLIKSASPNYKKVLGLVFLVLGLQMLLFGFNMLLNQTL